MMAGASNKSRVATLDEREVLIDPGFTEALRALADTEERDYSEVEKYARECLEELAVRPADRYLSWVAKLARFMISRSFDPEFDVNAEAIERLKQLARSRPLVFLWSHKSHLDSFVFMRALYDAGFTPQPLSFAGINMAFAGFGALAKHSGAIFLRRTFKDDNVYKLVLQHFIDYLVRERAPLSWSIEGTRSRTGTLMQPKLGLIQWVAESCKRAAQDDVLFVPVAISFDQIPEIDDYIAMQRGIPKRKETLKWFIEFVAGMKTKFGRIYVRFADPVSLAEAPPVSTALLQEDRDRAQVQRLAFEICNRIEHAKPITATDLVTLILLAANGRALDLRQIRNQATPIIGLIRDRDLPTAGDIGVDGPANLQATLDKLTETGLLTAFERRAAPVYRVTPGRLLAAAYYRNTIVHYFLNDALGEIALAMTEPGWTEQDVVSAALALRDLFKFEFFFKNKQVFREGVTSYLDDRHPQWRTRPDRWPARSSPLFGQGIFRSFVEAYLILGRLLVDRNDQPVGAEDRGALVAGCLDRGEELLLRKEISTEAAISQPLFETALRLADYRGLLSDECDDISVRRREFVVEIERVRTAIELLQERYDDVLDEHSPPKPTEMRSIA